MKFSELFVLLRHQLIEQLPEAPFLETIMRPLRRTVILRCKQNLWHLLNFFRSRLIPLHSLTWVKAIGRMQAYLWRRVSGGILAKGWALPRRLDNVTRSTERAVRRYPISPIVNCRVLMVRADRGQRSSELAEQRWAAHTNGQIDTVLIRGGDVGHHSMIRDPFVCQIAEPLAAMMTERVNREPASGGVHADAGAESASRR
jgi:hypothetical protein